MAGKRMSKSQFVGAVAEQSELSKKQVTAVLDAMNALIIAELGKKGPGEVVLPGLLKLVVVNKPAVPAHKGINPFTKEPAMFKAKPARKVVKARALKGFKDSIK
jgi:nucleoid DNA-binding protein